MNLSKSAIKIEALLIDLFGISRLDRLNDLHSKSVLDWAKAFNACSASAAIAGDGVLNRVIISIGEQQLCGSAGMSQTVENNFFRVDFWVIHFYQDIFELLV